MSSAVAGGGVVGEDHVARLLAAEREVALLERVEHVAVADRRLDHRRCRAARAPGGSPRFDITVATTASPRSTPAVVQVDRGDREDLVAVDELAALVDRDHPVGVAVEREPGVGAARRAPPPGARSGWVEPQPSLMFDAVGRRVDARRPSAPSARSAVGAARNAAPLRAVDARRAGRRAGGPRASRRACAT